MTPLGFLFPVYQSSRHNVWTINLGMWVYDGLSLFRSPKMHRNLSLKEIAEEEPALSNKGLKGAPLYYDCATDDARLTLENALDASEHGAVIATYIKAKSFLCEIAVSDVPVLVQPTRVVFCIPLRMQVACWPQLLQMDSDGS